ncbi:MAG: hypothetical protein KDK04_25625 [Candidatus Competibacteraceae bacterium]|nr:hypothetical protein [Candidatus Competibacteraceae bacterium]MCB1815070.1 hypothetical protein [Candidatus Competibacteraceae bacterium]
MGKRILFIAGVLVAAFWHGLVYAQSVTFQVEELTIPPSQITTTKCVQVGIFMNYSGPSATWGHLEISLDYTYPAGFLSGTPFVNVTDFSTPPETGLTNPGSPMTNSSASSTPCAAADIINSATLGGASVDFMAGAGGTPAIVTETITDGGAGSGTVDVTSLSFGSLFTTNDGESYLVAVIEYPLAAPGVTGQIDITFRNSGPLSDNFISDGVTTLDPALDDGFIQIFQVESCSSTNFAVFDDAVGTNSVNTATGSTLNIDYLDPSWGGPGGEIDITVNYGANVVAYQITGDDGFDTGIVSVTGPGSSGETVNPTNTSTIYTVTYFTLGLDGITLAPGTPCTVTSGWNPPACTLNWDDGSGSPAEMGGNGVLTATLSNSTPIAGIYANIDVPDGAVGLADPIEITAATTLLGTSDGTATLEVINQAVDVSWLGNYSITDVTNPEAINSSCSASLSFDTAPVPPSSFTGGFDPAPVPTLSFTGLGFLVLGFIFVGIRQKVFFVRRLPRVIFDNAILSAFNRCLRAAKKIRNMHLFTL